MKDGDADDLIGAIGLAARRDALIAPGALRRLLDAFAVTPAPSAASAVVGHLTTEEREVLTLVGAVRATPRSQPGCSSARPRPRPTSATAGHASCPKPIPVGHRRIRGRSDAARHRALGRVTPSNQGGGHPGAWPPRGAAWTGLGEHGLLRALGGVTLVERATRLNLVADLAEGPVPMGCWPL